MFKWLISSICWLNGRYVIKRKRDIQLHFACSFRNYDSDIFDTTILLLIFTTPMTKAEQFISRPM